MSPMTFKITTQSWDEIREQALVLPVFKGEKEFPMDMPKDARDYIAEVLREQDFKAEKDAVAIYRVPGRRQSHKGVPRVCLVGMGDRSEAGVDTHRRAFATATRALVRHRVNSVAGFVRGDVGDGLNGREVGEAVVDGALHGAYRFLRYRSDDNGNGNGGGSARSNHYAGIKGFHLVVSGKAPLAEIRKGMHNGELIGGAMSLARDMSNTAPNDLYPETMAQWAQRECKGLKNLRVKVFAEKDLARLKMGALMGVGQGSAQGPRFIVMEYKGGSAKQKPLVFVGKGVTFDSGGLCIKPGKGMEEMSYDMCGGAAVIAGVAGIARLGLKVNVVGLVPAAENMPSGTAYRPGDILTASDGTSIEVVNTDGEGRLLIAESLLYAKRYEPEYVVDLATLTGAIMIALGDAGTGLFSYDEELSTLLLDTAGRTGDVLWRMPMVPHMRSHIRSRFANIKNASGSRAGGAITAALFLHHFTEGLRWAHCDIAGTAWTTSETPPQEPGATGWGVKLLIELARKRAGKN